NQPIRANSTPNQNGDKASCLVAVIAQVRNSPGGAAALARRSLIGDVERGVNTPLGALDVAHARAVQDVARQPLYLNMVGIARGIHLVVVAIIRGGLVLCPRGVAALTPIDSHRLIDETLAVLFQHLDIDMVLAARLLFIGPARLYQPP